MRPRTLLLLACLFLALPAVGSAETVYSAAGRQDPLDNQGGAARPSALGSAFVGVADDASAVLWNPAGLSGLFRSDLSIHHSTWFGSTQEVFTLGVPVKRVGGFCVTGQYVDYGSFEGRDPDGTPLGEFTANQMGLGAGWGGRVIGDLSVGAALRGTQQTLAEKSYSLFTADAGALVTFKPGWRVGVSYANGAMTGGTLSAASAFRVGVSRRLEGERGSSVLAALAGNLEPRIGNSVQAGLEGIFNRTLTVRIGWDGKLRRKGYGGLSGLTAGAGLGFNAVQMDYAFVPYGDLGDSHRFSLGYKFGNDLRAAPSPTVTPSLTPTPTSTPYQSLVTPQAAPAQTDGREALTLEFELPADETARAQALVKEGKSAEAVRAYLLALQKNPQDSRAWWELGMLYYRSGQKAYAIRCFDAVVKLRPTDQKFAEWLTRYKAQP